MKLAGPYLIDGRTYNREELEASCQRMATDQRVPGWYKKVFAFIDQFLLGSGPIPQPTSGTTGDPREIELDREAMVKSARKTLSFFNLRSGDRILHCLPVDYIAGKMMVVRALAGGLDLVLREPSGRPLEAMSKKIRFAAMVPLQLHNSIMGEDDLSFIDTLLIGGGELHPSIREKLKRIDPPATFESFAMTETYTHFALRQINGPVPDSEFKLLGGVKISVDDRGCLVVDIPGITNSPVITNDLVEIVAKGGGFRWKGRLDNVINTGGIKIIPELLEKRIRELLDAECLILPGPDARLGQKLLLLVEFPQPHPPVEKWVHLLRKQLSQFEVPKTIIPVPEIPRNDNFKPDRAAALKLHAGSAG